MTLVLADGCFDILHPGHIRYLQQARCYGDRLVVSLALDTRVEELKGKGRPRMTWEDRATMLRALRWVDEVLPSAAAHETIWQLRPNVYCKGAGSYVGLDSRACEDVGALLVLLPLLNNHLHTPYSTTSILRSTPRA